MTPQTLISSSVRVYKVSFWLLVKWIHLPWHEFPSSERGGKLHFASSCPKVSSTDKAIARQWWHPGLTSLCSLLQVCVSCSAGCLQLCFLDSGWSEQWTSVTYAHAWHAFKGRAEFAAAFLKGFKQVVVWFSHPINILLGPAVWQCGCLGEDKESSSNRAI